MTAKFGHAQLKPLSGNRTGIQQADSKLKSRQTQSTGKHTKESNPGSKAASQIIHLKPTTPEKDTKTLGHPSPAPSHKSGYK